MASIIEKYNQIYKKIKEISDEKKRLQEEIQLKQTDEAENISVRIAHLEEQLKKIDEYVLKVQGFRHLAEKHITSKNILTIEAPENYRVNLNRLRKWAMMIDPKEKTNPSESDDPYAQKVYMVATCDEFFLNKKKKEFTKKIAELKECESVGIVADINQKRKRIDELKVELKDLYYSEEFINFLKDVEVANKKFWNEKSPETYLNTTTDNQFFAPGAYSVAFPIEKEYQGFIKNQLGKFYDEAGSRILLPVEISLEKEFVMTVSCAPSKDKSLDKGLQNMVLNIINNSSAGAQKIYVIDGVRFNTSSMGSLKQLEKTFAMEKIPRNEGQLTETLEKIISTFADIDEKLGDYDSVKSYNDSIEDDKKINLTTIILYGWPNAYTGRNQELLKRIMTNYERYGVSFVTVEYKKKEELTEELKSSLPEYATHNAVHVRVFPNDCTIEFPDKKSQKFVWYSFNDSLSDKFAQSLKEIVVEKKVLGTEYVKRFSLENVPQYVRGTKSIQLPYGVDAKDKIQSISFDNENFASYLMGASGSGKSTLLHTLITGIIRNYHPDDVELWLADFKMAEFAQYINPMPPHIKYILLDESQELVYDLIDKLTEKMFERQYFFMQKENREWKKVENVPLKTHMPIIFVILDEFSIMSQAIAESEVYRLRLQNLLAKGRALGIKFIFSSQTFTTGIAGLSRTAKEQIQSRLAMKNSYNEIDETLELSLTMKTDQVKNWMDALPPHYVLAKYRDGDKVFIKRLQVMYFKGKGDEALRPQRQLIQRLKNDMKAVREYNPEDINTYVEKNPVVVDGNSYKAYNPMEWKKGLLSRGDFVVDEGEEIYIPFGAPRRMSEIENAVLTNESRENIMLIARGSEQACAASIIYTSMKTFEEQNGSVSVWAYNKNRIYRMYKDSIFSSYTVSEGIEQICTSIKTIKEKILRKESGNELIVLLGMDQICSDFELIDFGVGTNGVSEAIKSNDKYEAKTEEEKELLAEMKSMEDMLEPILMKIEEEGIEQGKSIEEIAQEIEEATSKFYQEYFNYTVEEEFSKTKEEIEDVKEVVETEVDSGYNALEDFKYIVKQGSRFGYHFMLCLNNISDVRNTKLSFDLFKHKLAFQLSGDDSYELFGSKIASKIPEHICQYSNGLEQYSLRPFLHKEIVWDGWSVDEKGNAVNTMIL